MGNGQAGSASSKDYFTKIWNSSFIRIICYAFLCQFTMAITNTVLPLYVINGLGMSAADSGLLGTFFTIGSVCCRFFAGYITDRFGRRTTLMLGGRWTDFGVSFFCGALVQWVLTPLGKMKVPPLISSMIAGALTTLLALLGARMVDRVNIEPVISGAIMPLLPGLAMTNAMRDTIRGDLVSGGARLGEAILSVMMLAAGIGLMLSMWGGGLL